MTKGFHWDFNILYVDINNVDIIQNKNIKVFYKAVINIEFMCRNPHECPEIRVWIAQTLLPW